jgi:hypothetical protein
MKGNEKVQLGHHGQAHQNVAGGRNLALIRTRISEAAWGKRDLGLLIEGRTLQPSINPISNQLLIAAASHCIGFSESSFISPVPAAR